MNNIIVYKNKLERWKDLSMIDDRRYLLDNKTTKQQQKYERIFYIDINYSCMRSCNASVFKCKTKMKIKIFFL